jgi:hypothetical protein
MEKAKPFLGDHVPSGIHVAVPETRKKKLRFFEKSKIFLGRHFRDT